MSFDYTEQSSAHNAIAHEIYHATESDARDLDTSAPVLEPALLASIHQLNLDYLELVIAECAAMEGATQSSYLPPKQRAALCALPARALSALAEMPYTLYSLGFEDETFWDSVCANATATTPASVVQRYARVGDETAQYGFCKIALLHAWHVAATNVMAARVIYAMPHATALRLARTPLWEITCIAASYAVLMMPRWPTNPGFWPDLIRFAGINDQRRLQTTRLLGTQLIASELEVACAMSRHGNPALASPRLRARKLQMERHLASTPVRRSRARR